MQKFMKNNFDFSDDQKFLKNEARKHGIRWVVQHKHMLMTEATIASSGAIRKHAELVAEDQRVRVYRLY